MIQTQQDFDLMVGRLDRILSEMVNFSKSKLIVNDLLDDENKQTLKHHAEDMVAAANKILKCLGVVEGTPQPSEFKETANSNLEIRKAILERHLGGTFVLKRLGTFEPGGMELWIPLPEYGFGLLQR